MIVVRDIFRVKFGQAKEAASIWKQTLGILQKLGYGQSVRMLTDLVGPDYYTLVLESSYDSLAQWEKAGRDIAANAEWQALYKKVIPLTETGRREVLRTIE